MIELPVVSEKKKRLPEWLKKPLKLSEAVLDLKKDLRDRGLHTVCEEAMCPNLSECWNHGTATIMILGDVCTRHCGFCSITAGKPEAVDEDEPRKAAELVSRLKLKHAVITCVARDDLDDFGSSHFVKVIEAIREQNPQTIIEVLTTDFQMNQDSMEKVCRAHPQVFNHNLETVARLTDRVRHRATYENSLEFLKRVKSFDSTIKTKSGIMLGLGETLDEIHQALKDLRKAGCSIVTIGQYLQPTTSNLKVVEYVVPKVFEDLEKYAYELGFESVASGPFVRSSYHADKMAERMIHKD